MSYLPRVENKYYLEKFPETFKKLISFFDGKPDPSNDGKLFKFNYLPDFHLNSNDRITSFSKICKKMILPERLTLLHEAKMSEDHLLPNPDTIHNN